MSAQTDNNAREVIEPPVITLSIQIQFSDESGEWVASSDTHPELAGSGGSADDAFRSLCVCVSEDNCSH